MTCIIFVFQLQGRPLEMCLNFVLNLWHGSSLQNVYVISLQKCSIPLKVLIFYKRNLLGLKWHLLISMDTVCRHEHMPYISHRSNLSYLLCILFVWSTPEDDSNTISHP